MRFWFGAVYGRACRLTGRIDECVLPQSGSPTQRSDVPGLAYANLAFLLGHADLLRGAVNDAVKLLHEALAGVAKAQCHNGPAPASCFALAEAHAKLGQPEEANEAAANARSCVPPDYLFMQTASDLATGWALAASGCADRGVDDRASGRRAGTRPRTADTRARLSPGGRPVG